MHKLARELARELVYKLTLELIRTGQTITDLADDHPANPGSFKSVKRVQEQIAAGHDVDNQTGPESRPLNQ